MSKVSETDPEKTEIPKTRVQLHTDSPPPKTMDSPSIFLGGGNPLLGGGGIGMELNSGFGDFRFSGSVSENVDKKNIVSNHSKTSFRNVDFLDRFFTHHRLVAE